MLDYSPTKTQKLLGNPDESANPTASSPACAGLAGEHCTHQIVRCDGWHLVKKTHGCVDFFLSFFFFRRIPFALGQRQVTTYSLEKVGL